MAGARLITGAIQVGLWLFCEGVRNKCLGSEFRSMQVPSSYPRTTDPDFTDLASFHGLHLLVKKIHRGVEERLADRWA